MRMLAFCALAALLAAPCAASEHFEDVPTDHWAAEAVDLLAGAGIVQGYPDRTFQGDKTVTRYELAVALERMVHFIQESRKPLVAGAASAPAEPQAHWADGSVRFLRGEGFISPQSNLLKDGGKPVTTDELAQSLAMVAARLVELTVPPAETSEHGH